MTISATEVRTATSQERYDRPSSASHITSMTENDRTEIRKSAADLREKTSLRSGREYPVAIEAAADAAGYSVRLFDPNQDTQDYAALVDTNDKTIYVNSEYDIYEQAFVVAHEIGHIRVSGKQAINGFWIDNKQDIRGDDSSENEVEAKANGFATELLMPEKDCRVLWSLDLNLDDNIQRLSSLFGVKRPVAKKRADKLDLTSSQFRLAITAK